VTDTGSPLSQIVDPSTNATDAAMTRAVKAERDYTDGQIAVLKERLSGMDRATLVLEETVNRVPTALQEGLGHLQAVMDERFASIETQFKERDTRSERESRDNKVAVDAAFAAQKEAASEQNKSNTLAIDKSEKATAETIDKLAELVGTQILALADKVDDLKDRVARAEASKQGGRDSTAGLYALVGTLVAVSGLVLAAFLATH
jgi:cation transport regulator ChaB